MDYFNYNACDEYFECHIMGNEPATGYMPTMTLNLI